MIQKSKHDVHANYSSTFFLFFSELNCPIGIYLPPGKIRLLFPGKASCDSRATQPTVHAGRLSVSIIHRTLTWTTGSLTCSQMLVHAIAHESVRTPWESLHWKWTLGKKSLAAPGNRTCVSGVTVRRSTNWATSSLPHFSSCLVLRYSSLCLGSPRGLSSLRVKLTKSRAGQCPQAGQYQIWAPDLKSLKSSENWYSQTMF